MEEARTKLEEYMFIKDPSIFSYLPGRTLGILLLGLVVVSMEMLAQQPNIVVLFADDMGYGDVGCYNPQSKIPTPHMDWLASRGMRFTDVHSSSSVCTPSRYGLLTGRYAWRTKLTYSVFFNYEPPLIEKGRTTLASMLQGNGYTTACIGKWHLGLGWQAKPGTDFDFQQPWPWYGGTMPKEQESKIDFERPFFGGPIELGFDIFFGSSACPTCNPPYCFVSQDRVLELPTVYYEGKYLEQRSGFRSPNWEEKNVDPTFVQKSQEFISNAAKASTPFFLYLPSSTPHEPCEKEVIPEFMQGASEAGARGDMVALFDWMVGEIIKTLKAEGVYENTLIFVTSDNGAKPGDYNRYTYGHKSCGDLRGFKGGIWEGGHRVPFIVNWPDKINPGSINEQLVGVHDIFATIAEVLEIRLPENAGEDSHSFLSGLISKEEGNARETLINHSARGVFAIRKGPWKYIPDSEGSGDGGRGVHRNDGPRPDPSVEGQLYHLGDDPFESYNLIKKEPQKVQELKALLTQQQLNGRSVPYNGKTSKKNY